jgi:hypothetical protein
MVAKWELNSDTEIYAQFTIKTKAITKHTAGEGQLDLEENKCSYFQEQGGCSNYLSYHANSCEDPQSLQTTRLGL